MSTVGSAASAAIANNPGMSSDGADITGLFANALAAASAPTAAPNPIPTPPSRSPFDTLPSANRDQLSNLIIQAAQGIPAGTGGIIGTRINVAPEELLNALPPEVRKLIPAATSASIAIILPPDAIQRLQTGGVGDVLLNSTLWLGLVPPSGLINPSQSGNTAFQNLGTNGAYVMTIKMNGNPFETGKSPSVDFRAGWAFLNDIRPQNIGSGQSPIVPDKVDPDTWLFVNAGISGDFSNLPQVPDALQQGVNQLADSIQVSPDGSVGIQVKGGGVITGGALARVPFTEQLAHVTGDALVSAGQWISELPTPITTIAGGLVGALGVVLKQSTGLYLGFGESLSKLTVSTKGEVVFAVPGSSFSANLGDTPAAVANLASSLVRPNNPTLANQLNNSVQPTRTTISDIIRTPTNVVGGKPVPNELRLGLYWNEIVARNPNLDFTNLAYGLIKIYDDPKTSAAEKQNISYLYFTPEMQPVRLLIDAMFGDSPTTVLLPYVSPNGTFSTKNLAEAFKELKQDDPVDYSKRVNKLAQSLHDAGFSFNFGIADLAKALDKLGPIKKNEKFDIIAPHIKAEATGVDDANVLGDLYQTPGDASPALTIDTSPSIALTDIPRLFQTAGPGGGPDGAWQQALKDVALNRLDLWAPRTMAISS